MVRPMYPDVRDVELTVREMKLSPRPKLEDIWPDVVLVRSFLDNSRGRCYNHGRHQFILVSELKKIAEDFIGRSVSDSALSVGMRMQRLEVKASKKDGQSLVKTPPLGRFEEARLRWNQHQRDLEQEITEEVQRMEAIKKFSSGTDQ